LIRSYLTGRSGSSAEQEFLQNEEYRQRRAAAREKYIHLNLYEEGKEKPREEEDPLLVKLREFENMLVAIAEKSVLLSQKFIEISAELRKK
jgi:hypothetical protein